MNKKKYIYWIVLPSIIFIIFYIYLDDRDRTHIVNILGIIGFILSLVGLYITYEQVITVKMITEKTKKEVEKSTILRNNILLMSELSSKVEIVNAIEGYLMDGKYDICIIRLKDLQSILNFIKNHEQYYALVNKKNFQAIVSNLSIDLFNIQKCVVNSGVKNKIDKPIIIEHLNDVRAMFDSVEIKIKNS